MKRKINALTAMLLCMIATTLAQTSVTLGTFGYARVQKPATNLNIVGNCFGTATLNEVLPVSQFKGDVLFGNADRVIIWDSGTDLYTTYALYDDSAYAGSTVEWRDAAAFYGTAVNPVIPSGSSFWIQSSGSQTNSTLVISGDVVNTAVATNQISAGLQMISYPFSMNVDLNDTMLKNNATGDLLFGSADRVIAWNVTSQLYVTYALYDDTGYSGTTREWRDASNFYNPAGPINVELAQGFWYEAQNAFTWVEMNKYYNNL